AHHDAVGDEDAQRLGHDVEGLRRGGLDAEADAERGGEDYGVAARGHVAADDVDADRGHHAEHEEEHAAEHGVRHQRDDRADFRHQRHDDEERAAESDYEAAADAGERDDADVLRVGGERHA